MTLLGRSLLAVLALSSSWTVQQKPEIRYAGLTREAALRCPGAGCVGTVTASPGEQMEFWVAGSNLTGVTGIQFQPSEGIEVSNIEPANDVVRAVLKISAGAALGKRSFVVTSAAGNSNESKGQLNISTFRISDLKIDNVANSNGTLTFRVTFNYADPTGAASVEGFDLYTTLNIAGRLMGGIGSGYMFRPEGRIAGAKSGVISFTRSYDKVQGTTGATFSISLGLKDGRESNTLQAVF